MSATSVKTPQLRPDADVLPQDACEPAALGCALETRQARARVRAAPGLVSTGHENTVADGEAQ
jgi:hypothetical protein